MSVGGRKSALRYRITNTVLPPSLPTFSLHRSAGTCCELNKVDSPLHVRCAFLHLMTFMLAGVVERRPRTIIDHITPWSSSGCATFAPPECIVSLRIVSHTNDDQYLSKSGPKLKEKRLARRVYLGPRFRAQPLSHLSPSSSPITAICTPYFGVYIGIECS